MTENRTPELETLDGDTRRMLRIILREEAAVGPGVLNALANWYFVRIFHRVYPNRSKARIRAALERLRQLAEESGDAAVLLDADAREVLWVVLVGPGLHSFITGWWVWLMRKELKIPEARVRAALERLRQLAEEPR